MIHTVHPLRGQLKITDNMGVGKGWTGGAAPPDFKLMLLCIQAVTVKGRPNLLLVKITT